MRNKTNTMDFDGFSLFLQVVAGLAVFALFRWAKGLRGS